MDYHIEKQIIGIFELQSFRNESYFHFQIKVHLFHKDQNTFLKNSFKITNILSLEGEKHQR